LKTAYHAVTYSYTIQAVSISPKHAMTSQAIH